ncbi:MAG: primosomal protein N', partial [Planctomycetes bacterium]|nr:primosomal protein N' [Planctomycetota bacterium]
MAKAEQRHLFPQTPDQLGPAVWERAAERDQAVAGVVFNRPLETVFHYLVPDELRLMLAAGQRVKAPFGKGNRLTVGFCVGVETSVETSRRLKSLDSIIDREPLLSADMLELTKWIAERYLCGWGQVLESVVPAGVKQKAGTRSINVFRTAPDAELQDDGSTLPAKQRAVWNLLAQSDRPLTAMEITDSVGCGTAPIEGLRKKGLIQVSRHRRSQFAPTEIVVESEADLSLNRDQQAALDGIVGVLESRKHRTILLHGVTGSGKTEVYIRAIREVVGYRRQAIIIVPEISLTPQTIRRFRSRFDSVAVLHSHLSDAERHWQWQRIVGEDVQVVVGARSALFAPLPHLGLIVIDEEHETTFKQDSTPRYHAREVARKRAEILGIPLILGTATPTLESWVRASEGDDLLLSLPRRVAGLPLPPVIIVDVRNDRYFSSGSAIGRALATAMQNALENDGQIILFLNVRGFSPILWCHACGNPLKCPHCDITLTWHKDRNVALCHSCEYKSGTVTQCSSCGRPGITLFGIGTQRLEAEVRARFGKYRCLRMDSDSMRKPGSHEESLQAFGRGDVRILLGTQMIAKGLDFPNVTLVGVINADTVLHQPDLRAAERTFQLISQVAGRTGRGRQGGRVFVQTCSPNEPAILYAAEHNYLGFAAAELVHRRELNLPPFT